MKMKKKGRKEEKGRRERREQKGSAKRRCDGFVCVEAIEIFSQRSRFGEMR